VRIASRNAASWSGVSEFGSESSIGASGNDTRSVGSRGRSSATIASRVIVRNTRNQTPMELRMYIRRSFFFLLSLRPFTSVVQPRSISPSSHFCTSVDIS
jgi:hypothetical protein